jgi:hypothetical protein
MHIKTTNGAYEKPYSIGQLRKDNPNTSFPKYPTDELLAEWGVYPVKPTNQPSVDYTKNVIEKPPVKQGDQWVQVWEVSDATQSEIEQRVIDITNNARYQRGMLLAESDWTQLDDSPLSSVQKGAWATYRQALRDITQQESFPWAVDWPTQPE